MWFLECIQHFDVVIFLAFPPPFLPAFGGNTDYYTFHPFFLPTYTCYSDWSSLSVYTPELVHDILDQDDHLYDDEDDSNGRQVAPRWQDVEGFGRSSLLRHVGVLSTCTGIWEHTSQEITNCMCLFAIHVFSTSCYLHISGDGTQMQHTMATLLELVREWTTFTLQTGESVQCFSFPVSFGWDTTWAWWT